MQFREKGQKILCIRTEYLPEKKRTVGRTIASLDRRNPKLSVAEMGKLTADEVNQFKAWAAALITERNREDLEDALKGFAVQADKAAQALALESPLILTEAQAAAAWESIAAMQKALKKAGYPRPKQTSSESVQKPALDGKTGQLPLDA